MAHEDAQTRLRSAAFRGDVDRARDALVDGADARRVDEYGESMLKVAVLRGHVDVARLLIARGADVCQTDRHGFPPLCCAVIHNKAAAAARFLLRRGADIMQGNDFATPLEFARRARARGDAPAGSAAALVLHVDDLLRKGVWSLETHHGLPAAKRARAVEVWLVGRLKFNRGGPPPDWWHDRVMPFAI